MTDSDVDHIRVYRDTEGEFRWAGIAGNGEIVAQGEAHTRREDALRAAFGVLGDTVPVRDEQPS